MRKSLGLDLHHMLSSRINELLAEEDERGSNPGTPKPSTPKTVRAPATPLTPMSNRKQHDQTTTNNSDMTLMSSQETQSQQSQAKTCIVSQPMDIEPDVDTDAKSDDDVLDVTKPNATKMDETSMVAEEQSESVVQETNDSEPDVESDNTSPEPETTEKETDTPEFESIQEVSMVGSQSSENEIATNPLLSLSTFGDVSDSDASSSSDGDINKSLFDQSLFDKSFNVSSDEELDQLEESICDFTKAADTSICFSLDGNVLLLMDCIL